jgi:hypothetical protein
LARHLWYGGRSRGLGAERYLRCRHPGSSPDAPQPPRSRGRVWWVSSLAAALELAKAVGAAPSAVEEAERLIRAAAQERGIALAEHEPTLARAKAALARLDHGLAVAEQRGILAASNSRFKFLRLKDPKLDYGKAHSRLKFEIARRIAETSDGGLPDLRGLVNAILPMPTK